MLYLEHSKEADNKFIKYSCCRTQEELAEKLGVERRTIGNWETGKSTPPLEKLIQLSELFDCSIDYFFGTGDLPEIDPISKAAHYSGISPKIIRFGLENPDYLDCLNFFMLPDNCSALFNDITLNAGREYTINQELEELKEPLKSAVINVFEKFSAVTPISKCNKETYKKFLISALPENKLTFTTKRSSKGLNIKANLKLIRYQQLSLFNESEHRYYDFINYLTDYTYEPLMKKSVLEIQKNKLAKMFVSLFEKYLSE